MFQVNESDTLRTTIAVETNLHTNFGDVEAFFLPATENFKELSIIERRSHQGYVYTFKGKPRVDPGFRIETTGRDYYLKYENTLLIVSNTTLQARLENALGLQRTH